MPNRVAIIGAGMYAHRHVTGWREAGTEVVAACRTDPVRLAEFVDRYDIPEAYTDWTELIAGTEADIVDICTPPWLHAPMTIAALEAGKHVLCEKPFALSSNEADDMVAAADAASRVLACRQGETRLSREARMAAEVVRSGVLGEIYLMRLTGRALYRPGVEFNPEADWFLDRSRAGGGALFDLGVYDLELLWALIGELDVAEIIAVAFRGVDHPGVDTPFDVEEHIAAMLRLHIGPRIYWERAWATHLPPEHRWDLYGTAAGFSFVPHSGSMVQAPMAARLTRYAPEQPIDLPVPPLPPPGPSVYEDFLQAVNGEHAPACPGRDAANMLRILEAIYAAAGEPVSRT